MNKWNVLLSALDKTYGSGDKGKSSYKPIKRYFNQESGEMITVLEYREKRQGEIVIKNGNKQQSRQRKGLLQALLQQKKAKGN